MRKPFDAKMKHAPLTDFRCLMFFMTLQNALIAQKIFLLTKFLITRKRMFFVLQNESRARIDIVGWISER